MKDVAIILRTEKEIKDKLTDMAKKEDRSLSNYVYMVLKKVAFGEIKVK